jgi:ribosome biogenesis GTPase A
MDKEKVKGYICILDGYDILVSVSSINLQRFLSVHAKKKGSNVVFNRIDFYEVDDINKWVSYLDNENIFKSDMLSPTPNKAISFHNQSDLDKIKIENLDLSVSVYNAFKAAKINTLYDAAQKTAEDLMSIRWFGKKALRDVQLLLSAYSLTLKQ